MNDPAFIHQLSFINYHYEKETRTKANHFKHRTSDCIQHSCFSVIQQ